MANKKIPTTRTDKKYEEFRENLKKMVSVTDDKPPKLKVPTYLKVANIAADKKKLKFNLKENFEMLKIINVIQRTTGFIDCFQKEPLKSNSKSKAKMKLKAVLKLEKENRALFRRFNAMGSKTYTGLDVLNKGLQRKLVDDNIKVMLPKIFFDVSYKKSRLIGRIVLQLATCVCPDVVMNFVRFCKKNHIYFKDQDQIIPSNCELPIKITRVFPGLYFESEIAMNRQIHDLDNMCCRKEVINHSRPGILSFDPNKILNRGHLYFAISLKAMPILDEKRTGIGRIIEGLDVLTMIEGLGTKNGKVIKSIEISNCGLINY